jgi:hypothetical protein
VKSRKGMRIYFLVAADGGFYIETNVFLITVSFRCHKLFDFILVAVVESDQSSVQEEQPAPGL